MPVRPGRNGAAKVVELDVLNRYAKDPKDFEKAIERFNTAKAEAKEAHARTVAANRELDQRISEFEANKRRQAEWLEEEQRKLGRTASKYEKLSTGLANRIQRSRDEKERLAGVEEMLEAREEATDFAGGENLRLERDLITRDEQLKEDRRLHEEYKAEFEKEKAEHRKRAAALKKNLSEVMADGDS